MKDEDARSPHDEEHPETGERRPSTVKVTDRRLFDRDGNVRGDATADAPAATSATAAAQPPVESADEPAPTAPPPVESADEPAPTAPPPVESADEATAAADPTSAFDAPDGAGVRDLPRDFSAFVQGQYFEAMLYLGAMPHPQTGQVQEDLDLARYKIDVLAMLHDKTEGNRTPEESQLLDEVLYQLRMLFLQKSNVARV